MPTLIEGILKFGQSVYKLPQNQTNALILCAALGEFAPRAAKY